LNETVVIQDARTPPSNAVDPSQSLPPNYWLALCGKARFQFDFTLPLDIPSSTLLADNAQCTYQLKGTAQLLYKGQKATLTRFLRIQVVERWRDWQLDHYWMPVKKEVMERLPTGQGSVFLEGIVKPALRWRGDEALEGDGDLPSIPVNISVNIASSKQVSSVADLLCRSQFASWAH
jgi:hypothetical protein